MLRDMAEHNALFWNPQGVEQVRQARENSARTDDAQFGQMLEDLFGKPADLPAERRRSGGFEGGGGLESLARRAPAPPAASAQWRASEKEADKYLEMDLDEVVFRPFVE